MKKEDKTMTDEELDMVAGGRAYTYESVATESGDAIRVSWNESRGGRSSFGSLTMATDRFDAFKQKHANDTFAPLVK